ncbi:MAG: tRNA-dihydrouridine synthase [Deltaproteobacteria bacterium]|nr:tRNA-dihydrouridine synthase [Deltaproteobacteria bacterium]
MLETTPRDESAWERFEALYRSRPAILAPMEDVSDAVFRRVCRTVGADVCFTEFVNCEGLLRGAETARRKLTLSAIDQPTAVQIYGSNPARLAEAAQVAAEAGAAFVDINCGCWVPKVAGAGAGAAWLRDPSAMVAMAEMVVRAISLPVTVKTRIGYGPESHMPIVDLAQRLEGVGVAALTVHCRTAEMGHTGKADWVWAQRAQEKVRFAVMVNGDVCSGEDAARALERTGCAGVMIGRRAIEHPWVFREVRARLDRGETLALPTLEERFALCHLHLAWAVEALGEREGLRVARRHLGGYLSGVQGAARLRKALHQARAMDEVYALLDRVQRGEYIA